MTIAQLVSMVDLLYPNIETTQNKVTFMNQAQRILNPYFSILVAADDLTEAGLGEYPLPTGCTDVSQIVSLGISKTVTTPENRYDFTYYKKNTAQDYPTEGNGYFQIVSETGVKGLVIYPTPDTDDHVISILFRKPLTELVYTTTTQVPDFDSNYHDLLAFYAAHMICMKGANPDTMQADAFMQKWESGLREIYRKDMNDKILHPKKARDNPQWHSGKRFFQHGTPEEGGGEV